MSSLEDTRSVIAQKVRDLRQSRQWTQAELAKHLGLSQSRLSEIERGGGSFTAEQFLLVLKLFNVAVTDFVERQDPDRTLQNTLVRLGADHLRASTDVVATGRHGEANQVVRDALIDGSPRVVAAVGPVLLRNIKRLNVSRLHAELTTLGYERRVAWVVDNTLAALDELRKTDRLSPELERNAREATLMLREYLDFAMLRNKPGEQPEDILDPTIRSAKTLQEVRTHRSPQSRQWGIVTSVKPSDFANAFRAAYVGA